jgi:hypothetical protein
MLQSLQGKKQYITTQKYETELLNYHNRIQHSSFGRKQVFKVSVHDALLLIIKNNTTEIIIN